MNERYTRLRAAVDDAVKRGNIGGDYRTYDVGSLLCDHDALAARLAAMERGGVCIWCGEALDLTGKDMESAVEWARQHDAKCPDNPLRARLAEAVAALHDIAHAEPEASALRLRFMAADALIRHNTADSADVAQGGE